MAFNLVVPAIAVAPALALLLADVARHEPHFRDEGILFALVVGAVGGFVAVIVEAFFVLDANLWLLLLGAPLVEAMVLVAVSGLPRYRHESAAVWYGGAAGLAMAALLLLGQAQPDIDAVARGNNLLRFALAAVGGTIVHYAAGMVAGYGAAKNRILVMLPIVFGLLIPAQVLLIELGRGGNAPFQGGTLWAVLLVLYAALVYFGVVRRAHRLGVDPNTARATRRAERKRMRG